jgi:hypothetical protein
MAVMNMRLMMLKLIVALPALAAAMVVPGCAATNLIGAMAESEESQKLLEVHERYSLENKTVAVVTQCDYATMFEHPDLVVAVTSGVTVRIARWAPNVQIMDPQQVLNWQLRTPQWNALPYGEIATQLNVDRVVFVDILEYRLNPPGNRYLWDGAAVARIGIVERDGLDADAFAETFDVQAKFPDMEGVTRESASEVAIRRGVQDAFVKRIAWLFHYHYEPKHPDKYRPELDTKEMRALKQKTGS